MPHPNVIHYGDMPNGAGGQSLPFSPALRAGDFVFVSGQVAMNERGEIEFGGIEAQTHQTFANIKKALALAGCTLEDVVKATVWLDDTRDFWSFNRVYVSYFPSKPPARSCVQSAMMVDCKVEIEVMAYKPL
jgi:reactive intermediate/imine deaminase